MLCANARHSNTDWLNTFRRPQASLESCTFTSCSQQNLETTGDRSVHVGPLQSTAVRSAGANLPSGEFLSGKRVPLAIQQPETGVPWNPPLGFTQVFPPKQQSAPLSTRFHMSHVHPHTERMTQEPARHSPELTRSRTLCSSPTFPTDQLSLSSARLLSRHSKTRATGFRRPGPRKDTQSRCGKKCP